MVSLVHSLREVWILLQCGSIAFLIMGQHTCAGINERVCVCKMSPIDVDPYLRVEVKLVPNLHLCYQLCRQRSIGNKFPMPSQSQEYHDILLPLGFESSQPLPPLATTLPQVFLRYLHLLPSPWVFLLFQCFLTVILLVSGTTPIGTTSS